MKQAMKQTKAVPKKAKFIPKPSDRKLAVVKPSTIQRASHQKLTPEAPASHLTASFKNKAIALDKKIRDTVDGIERGVTALGTMFRTMKDQAYFTALGYSRFDVYIEEVCGKSKTQIFQAMAISKELTSGDNPVATPEQVDKMPRDNAMGLAQLKKRGKKITPALIAQAQSMTISKFKESVVFPNAPDLAQRAASSQGKKIEGSPTVLVRRVLIISSDTNAEYEQCLKIGAKLALDEDMSKSVEEKIFTAMCANFRAEYEQEYNAILEQEEAEARQRADVSTATGFGAAVDVTASADAADEIAEGEMSSGVGTVAEAAEGKDAEEGNSFDDGGDDEDEDEDDEDEDDEDLDGEPDDDTDEDEASE